MDRGIHLWWLEQTLISRKDLQELQEQRADLLTALERLLGSLDAHGSLVDMDDEAWEQACAAIAKTRGDDNE